MTLDEDALALALDVGDLAYRDTEGDLHRAMTEAVGMYAEEVWKPISEPIPESCLHVILWNEDRGCAIVVAAHVATGMTSPKTPEHLRFMATKWRWFDYPKDGEAACQSNQKAR